VNGGKIMPVVKMDADYVAIVARPFINQLNAVQKEGVSIDEALAGALYAIGHALKQRGALIDFDKPIRNALLPLVWGTRRKCDYALENTR